MKKTISTRTFVRSGFLILAFFFFMGSSSAQAAIKFWRGEVDSNFSNAGNWSSSSTSMIATTVPNVNDVATYNANGNVDCDLDSDINVGGINILAGYKKALTQNDGISISIGDSSYSQADGLFRGGNSSIINNGSFILTGGSFISSSDIFTVRGNWLTHSAINGAFAHNFGTVKFANSGDRIINVNGSETFNNLILAATSNAALIASSNDTLKTLGTLSLVSGYATLSGSSTFEAQGNVIISSSYHINNTQPLLFSGTNLQTLDATGAITSFRGNININKVNAEGISAGTVQLLSNLTMSSGKTLSILKGSLDLNGKTFTAANVVYASDASLEVTGVLNVLNDYFQSAGIVNLGSSNTNFSGKFTLTGGKFISTSGIFSVSGNWDTRAAPVGAFVHNGGTVRLAMNGNRTINVNGSEIFNHLTIAGTSSWTMTEGSGTTLKVLGNLNLNSGALIQSGNSRLEAEGDVFFGSAYLKANNQALQLSGSADQTITATLDKDVFNGDLHINKVSGVVTLGSALILDAADQDLILSSGSLVLAGNNLTVNGINGTLQVAAGATLQLNGSESITTLSTSPSLAAGSIIKYVGTASGGSPDYTIKNYNYSNLTIAGGPSTLFAQAAATSVSGVLKLSGGIFDLASFNLSGTGVIDNDSEFSGNARLRLRGNEIISLIKDSDSGVVEYTGAGAYPTLAYGPHYYNLIFNAPGSFTQTETLDVNSHLTLSAGTLNSAGRDIFVAGNWFNAATYNSGTNTVTLDGVGNQTISGSNTFYNLTKTSGAALSFTNASTQTITHALTLKGSSAQKLALRSDKAGSQWNINAQGTKYISYLDVKDSNNVNSDTLQCLENCVDSSNNTGWSFSPPAVNVSATSVSVTEGSSPVTYNVTLASAPNGNVTITPSSSDFSYGVSVSPASLVFTPLNWNIPQIVTVSALDDTRYEGDHSATISHAVSGGDYDSVLANSVLAQISDNDAIPNIAIENPSVVEGNLGTKLLTFNLTLSSSSVKRSSVNFSTKEGTAKAGVDYSDISGTINFEAGQTSKSVEVLINGDVIDENDEIFTLELSNPTEANLIQSTATATILNDDLAPILSINNVSVNEGNIATSNLTFTLTLSSLSEKTIHVDYATMDRSAYAASDYISKNGTLSFSPGQNSQTVEVVIIGDGVVEATETFELLLTNPISTTFTTASVLATIINDDHAPQLSDPGNKTIRKGTALSFSLNAFDADGNVLTYSCVANCPAGLWVNASSALVTWIPSESQKGAFDNITFKVVDSAGNEDTKSISITVAGITLSQTGDSLNVSEGGVTDTYTLVLDSEPSDVVSIQLAANSQVSTNPTLLTFNSENWNIPQTVMLSALDDAIEEAVHSTTLSHSIESSDFNYSDYPISDLIVNITDNDKASVSIVESGGSTQVSEEGISDVYSVVLTSQPTAEVKVQVVSIDAFSGVLLAQDLETPSGNLNLIFTEENWNIPQSVTVTALDDFKVEGMHNKIIRHFISSDDLAYKAFSNIDLGILVSDNDSAGVNLSKNELNIGEDGTQDSYAVVLSSEPNADVIVTLSAASPVLLMLSDADSASSIGVLNFTSSNWNIPQTIQVSVLADSIHEGGRLRTIAHSSSSTDESYNHLSLASVNVNIADLELDAAGITLSTVNMNLREGDSEEYTFVLNSAPSADVVIKAMGDEDLSVSPASLKFSSSDWYIPKSFTVTALKDKLTKKEKKEKKMDKCKDDHKNKKNKCEDREEEENIALIKHIVLSSDAHYNLKAVPEITVNIIEKDAQRKLKVRLGKNQSVHVQSSLPLRARVRGEGGELNYEWSIVSGSGTLSEKKEGTVLYRAGSADTEVQIRVIVSDEEGRSASDELEIKVWGEKDKKSKEDKDDDIKKKK